MKHEVPDDGLTHDLTDNGVNCMCDPVVDWDNNTVHHKDLRPLYNYTKQLLTEAEDIKEKESKYAVLGKLVSKSVKQNIELKKLVEAAADREDWNEFREAQRELDEFIDKLGRRAALREKIKTYMNRGMLVRAPLVEAEQNGSIRIQDLTKVVMARRRLGMAEERLVPFEAAGNVAYADDRPMCVSSHFRALTVSRRWRR
jgi:hypothetical protein